MPTLTPSLVDQTLLEMRARVLSLAADLDRLQRGGNWMTLQADPRMAALREAIETLKHATPDRAQRVQMIFSDHSLSEKS